MNLCLAPQGDGNRQAKPYECPNVAWSCWKKYHEFYHERDVFQTNGRQNKKSALCKIKASMTDAPQSRKRKSPHQEEARDTSAAVRRLF
ncbi:hypothetical protein SDRG_17444 [Saprolegnia diclina VS20]|uniref:Uncharacterized protein n=1 Tax=Saprolegnia diclina (strain VS20) TaxID=1156394 RepID=T0QY24_SAPDV|nr:hypothetical protein SDRG_17444 [Saprolegnia diclina VS20]EQC24663.1 hypothetical protein SDRG_17444 [Saprolegnia diclina VS20]|eukprot:XP_008621908.1 hypothetical protein SDRG_17444 [Saprolegnia diclina VS20]